MGIYLNTDVVTQGATKTVNDNDQKTTYPVRRVADANVASYEALVQQLQTGDLLYIAGAANLSKAAIQQDLTNGNPPQITHVIMWVGDVGVADGVPLVTDSHGGEVVDANGKNIPAGIQVRPFNNVSPNANPATPTGEASPSWYFDHFLWALRVLPSL